jgi:hypothetical protein
MTCPTAPISQFHATLYRKKIVSRNTSHTSSKRERATYVQVNWPAFVSSVTISFIILFRYICALPTTAKKKVMLINQLTVEVAKIRY